MRPPTPTEADIDDIIMEGAPLIRSATIEEQAKRSQTPVLRMYRHYFLQIQKVKDLEAKLRASNERLASMGKELTRLKRGK